MTDVIEPLRDQIGRVLYDESIISSRNWYELSEERREPWRLDADRVLVVLKRVTDDHRALAKEIYQTKRHLGELGMIEAALAIRDSIG
jgi:hypothetical protein